MKTPSGMCLGGANPGLLQSIINFLLGWAYATTLKARHKSELLADSLAAKLVSADAISTAVREYAGNKSDIHPNRKKRLANIAAQRNTFASP